MSSPKYIIGVQEFKSKSALLNKIKGILYSYKTGDPLNLFDFDFMCEVLKRHPSYVIKKGAGIRAIEVRMNQTYKKHPNFWILRTDDSVTDFSFYECVSPSSAHRKFRDACRAAVKDDIIQFKHTNLNPDSLCPFTNEKLTLENTHVDHQPPKTFESIVLSFIAQFNINIETVCLVGSTDGVIGDSFEDSKGVAKQFREFHKENATLRLVSIKANLSNIKKEKRKMPTKKENPITEPETDAEKIAYAILQMGDHLCKSINALTSMLDFFRKDQKPAETLQTTTVSAPAFTAVTLDDLRTLFAAKAQAGKKTDLIKILSGYNAAKLPEVPEAKYAELKAKVEAL